MPSGSVPPAFFDDDPSVFLQPTSCIADIGQVGNEAFDKGFDFIALKSGQVISTKLTQSALLPGLTRGGHLQQAGHLTFSVGTESNTYITYRPHAFLS